MVLLTFNRSVFTATPSPRNSVLHLKKAGNPLTTFKSFFYYKRLELTSKGLKSYIRGIKV